MEKIHWKRFLVTYPIYIVRFLDLMLTLKCLITLGYVMTFRTHVVSIGSPAVINNLSDNHINLDCRALTAKWELFVKQPLNQN